MGVACHSDILTTGALDLDWVYATGSRTLTTFTRKPCNQQACMKALAASSLRAERKEVSHTWMQPDIRITIQRARTQEYAIFSKHHYKSHSINRGCRCFVAHMRIVNDPGSLKELVGFVGAISNCDAKPFPECPPMYRESRTVTLPDFQGLGIGSRLSDAVGELLIRQGSTWKSKTAHPKFGRYREPSPLWGPVKGNGHIQEKPIIWDGTNVEEAKKLKELWVPKKYYNHMYRSSMFSEEARAYMNKRIIIVGPTSNMVPVIDTRILEYLRKKTTPPAPQQEMPSTSFMQCG